MEGIQVTLQQKECLDDQQQEQVEQHSVQSFQAIEIQVAQENPANFPDLEKQFHDSRHQHSVLEKLNTKWTKGRKSESQGRVQFAVLLKYIIPRVDNDRATQLQKLFSKLRKNEITRENFLRLVKDIVGNQRLTEAVEKVRSQISSAKTSIRPQTEAMPTKRHCGHVKPIEEFATPLILSSKRQKSSETISDQSIGQLNDVTVVSGINLREEEQKLLSGPQEGHQMSKSSPRVQGEEGMLILQKIPLQEKLAKITSKCGIKSISKDVELCLSLSVEERIWGLIFNSIRISKQRVDFEERRHKTLITSDVRHQIKVMNQIVEEEREKRTAKESERGNQVGGDLEKDAKCSETSKGNKVTRMVDEVLHTTAVNVAARSAVGGDDWTSKWKLMAKKALKKHELGAMFNAQLSEQMTAHLWTSPRKICDGQESQDKGTENTFQGDQFVMSQKFVHPISAKDIMAVLERESQISKSTFSYCLYERLDANYLQKMRG